MKHQDPADTPDLTASGDHVILSKEDYAKLRGEADEAGALREELETLKRLAQSALGNISAVIRRADTRLQAWLSEEEDEPIQNT